MNKLMQSLYCYLYNKFMMLKFIVLFLWIILATAIYTKPAKHQTSVSKSRSHFQQLKNEDLIKLAYDEQITLIQDEVNYVTRTLDLKDSQKYRVLIQRTKDINTGMQALNRSLSKYKVFVSPQYSKCPGITTFNRTQITRYMVYTEDKEKDVSNYYSTCADCEFIIPQIDKMLDMIEKYFKLINNTLDGQSCQKKLQQVAQGMVNLNQSYFKNNLAAQNWFYGSITQSDYKILMFKRSATYNLTSCPITAPFVKLTEQVCFNCANGSIYDLGAQKCIDCESGNIFNIRTGTCQSCSGDRITQNNIVKCRPCVAASNEFYNSTLGKCQTCNGTNYFDKKNLQCKKIECPSSLQRFNTQTQLCQQCGASQISDPANPTRCIHTNYIGVCPHTRPVYNPSTRECEEEKRQ